MLDGRALEADAHAVSFLGDTVVGADEGRAALLAEIVLLRSPHDAHRPVAIVERCGELALLARRRVVEPERQAVVRLQLAALEAADAGARVGRKAAHEGRQR